MNNSIQLKKIKILSPRKVHIKVLTYIMVVSLFLGTNYYLYDYFNNNIKAEVVEYENDISSYIYGNAFVFIPEYNDNTYIKPPTHVNPGDIVYIDKIDLPMSAKGFVGGIFILLLSLYSVIKTKALP